MKGGNSSTPGVFYPARLRSPVRRAYYSLPGFAVPAPGSRPVRFRRFVCRAYYGLPGFAVPVPGILPSQVPQICVPGVLWPAGFRSPQCRGFCRRTPQTSASGIFYPAGLHSSGAGDLSRRCFANHCGRCIFCQFAGALSACETGAFGKRGQVLRKYKIRLDG